MDPAFAWTERARPFVEVGIGDTRTPEDIGARWGLSSWDDGAGIQPGTFWASTVEPSWLDVTCYVHQWESFNGRHRVTDRFEPGTLVLTAKNESGWADLDPENVAALEMRPGRQIRVGVDHVTLGRVVLWRGYVDAVVPAYDPVLEDIVTVEAIDALGEVGRQKMPELDDEVGANEAGSARITRILDAALWPDEPRDIDTTSVQMRSTHLGGQVADLLTQCAESEGGAVFGNQEGRICYRGRDWQTFDAGTPPDNAVGNVVVDDVPGIPTYLAPLVGYASTADPGPLPMHYTFVAHVFGPYTDDLVIASQGVTSGQISWRLGRRSDAAVGKQGWLTFTYSPDGTTASEDVRELAQLQVTGEWEWLAWSCEDDGAGNCLISTWTSEDGEQWFLMDNAVVTPEIVAFDSSAPLVIGRHDGSNTWDAGIAMVELREGMDPAEGDVLWRFDAAEIPLDALSYTDPRGRAWTLTPDTLVGGYGDNLYGQGTYGGDFAHSMVTPGTATVYSDVCPTSLEITHRRSDLVTQVTLGREGDEVPKVYPDDEGLALYGHEPYDVLDLICTQESQMDVLADRLFKTRGHKNAPRIEAIGFTAAKNDRTLDLLTTVDVFKPTRLRTRLARQRGKVYDAETFVTGVDHFISVNEWTCRMSLDIAKPWQIPKAAARWDIDKWNQASWAPDV